MTTLSIYKLVLPPASPRAHPMATYCHRVELKGKGREGESKNRNQAIQTRKLKGEEKRRMTKMRRHCPAQKEEDLLVQKRK